MRRFTLLTILVPVVLLPAVAVAQQGPRIKMDTKVLNLGTIYQGETAKRRVKFTNVGDAVLRVRKVQPKCSCTAALMTQEKYAPGESGTIEVAFDSQGRLGKQRIDVYVYTNDATQNDRGQYVTKLQVLVRVDTLVKVLPPSLYVANLNLGQASQQKRVVVMPSDESRDEGTRKLQVTKVVPSQPYIQAGTRPYKGAGGGVEVLVTVTGDAPPGKLEEHVTVYTNLERQPLLKVPVIAVVNPGVVAYPKRIPLYDVEPGSKEASRVIILERKQGKGLNVLEIEGNEELLSWELVEVMPGRKAEITLTLNESVPVGPFSDVLRIFLVDEQVPVIEIPVFGEISSQVTALPTGLVFNANRGELSEPIAETWLRARDSRALGKVDVADVQLVGLPGLDALVSDSSGKIHIALKATEGAQAGSYRGHLLVRLASLDETVRIEVRGQLGPTEPE